MAVDYVPSEQAWLQRVECCFTSTETVGLLGTGAQDGHLDFHTAPELCCKGFGGSDEIVRAKLGYTDTVTAARTK